MSSTPSEQIARITAEVGAALQALALAELPEIAAVSISVLVDRPRVELQLWGSGFRAAALLAWAEVLPTAVGSAYRGTGYIHVAVTGRLAGVAVEVWDHAHGAELAEVGRRLGLPVDPASRRVVVSRDTLRHLAQRQAVACDG